MADDTGAGPDARAVLARGLRNALAAHHEGRIQSRLGCSGLDRHHRAALSLLVCSFMTMQAPAFATRVLACSAALALVFQLNTESAAARDSVSKFQRKFVEVTAGKIYRGLQPGDEDDYEYLKRQGIRTTLNLRKYLKWQEKSLHRKADAHGFFYRHVGMPTLWYEPKDEEVNEALRDLNDAALQPVYLHCRLGKDRTGLIVALHRVLDEHWAPCTAWKEWKSIGYLKWNDGLKDYFEKRLRKETQIPDYDRDFKVGNCSS